MQRNLLREPPLRGKRLQTTARDEHRYGLRHTTARDPPRIEPSGLIRAASARLRRVADWCTEPVRLHQPSGPNQPQG